MSLCLIVGVLRVSAQHNPWLHRVAASLSLSLAAIVQEGPRPPSIKEGARGRLGWPCPLCLPQGLGRRRVYAISSAGVAFAGDAGVQQSGAGEVRL